MSAFMLSDDHHDAVLSYFITRPRQFGPITVAVPRETADAFGMKRAGSLGDGQSVLIQVTEENATAIGRFLIDANAESIATRYSTDRSGFEQVDGYTFKSLPLAKALRLTAVQVLKGLDCYDYQACEVDGYETTPAAALVNALRGAAIRDLPGYEAAPWGLDTLAASA